MLVEDDASLSTVLADYLRSKDYTVETANNGKEAWELIMIKHYDLIISDIMMPRMNMLTAKADRDDVIHAYELGCDDYVTKPFSMDILICKMEAVLRRCRVRLETEQTEWQLGDLVFDSVRQQIGGQHLSSRENELLLTLCQNMGKVVDRSRILTNLWGEDTYFNSRSLSVYINHLRNYIGKDSQVKILSVHGKEYKMVIMNKQTSKIAE